MTGLLTLLLAAAALMVIIGGGMLCHHMIHPPRRTLGAALALRLPTDPAEVGLNGEEIQFTFPDGSISPGWLLRGRVSDGPVVIYTHGWSNSRFGALRKAALLARHASQVVVYDLRAHGDSTAPACRQGVWEVDDLLQVLEQVRPEGKPVVLFGSSFGAGISIAAAAQIPPTQIRGLIVEGPYRHPMEPVAAHLRQARVPAYPIVWVTALLLRLRFPELRCFDRAAQARQLPCPLLVLHGSHDPLCKLHSAHRIADAAPDGQLVVIEGGGHGGLVDADPQTYVGALRAFFQKIREPRRDG